MEKCKVKGVTCSDGYHPTVQFPSVLEILLSFSLLIWFCNVQL